MGNPSVVRGNCRFCSADGGTWRHVGGRDSWWVCRAESDAAACGTACCDQRRSMQPPSCGWTDYSDPAGHRRLVARRCLLLVTTGRSWRSAGCVVVVPGAEGVLLVVFKLLATYRRRPGGGGGAPDVVFVEAAVLTFSSTSSQPGSTSVDDVVVCSMTSLH